MADCLIATGIPFKGREGHELFNAELAQMMAHTAGVRRWGAAALDLAYVAAGRVDGYWERGLSPWDLAAGLIIVREAGGYVSAIDGGPVRLDGGEVLAGNDILHGDFVKLLGAAQPKPEES